MLRISLITILSDFYFILYESSGYCNQIDTRNYTVDFRNKYEKFVLASGISVSSSNMKDVSLISILKETLKFNPNTCLFHPIFWAPYYLFKRKVKDMFFKAFQYILIAGIVSCVWLSSNQESLHDDSNVWKVPLHLKIGREKYDKE